MSGPAIGVFRHAPARARTRQPVLRACAAGLTLVWAARWPGAGLAQTRSPTETGPLSGVAQGFTQGLTQGAAAPGRAGSAALSDPSLSAPTSLVFQGFADPDDCSGELRALELRSANGRIEVASSPRWSAAALLDQQAPAARHLSIGRPGAQAQPAARALLWSEIDPALREQLNRPGASAPPDQHGPERLAFLRGERSQEGHGLRTRRHLLGGIAQAQLIYLDAPSTGPAYVDPGHKAFALAQGQRPPRLFAGAQDGMLHAFSASTGEELWAHMPSWLGPRLAALTRDGCLAGADVGAQPDIADAQRMTEQGLQWRSVLVTGTGAGGAGVFALDLSGPDPLGVADVLWEFTPADDADIGAVYGRPRIVKMRLTEGADPNPSYAWYALVPGGWRSPDADARTSGLAALFLLSLDKPAASSWAGHYVKIPLPPARSAAALPAPGLNDFSVRLGAAGEVAQIALGDAHGQLWLLDFSQAARAHWDLAHLSAFQHLGQARPFYSARGPDGSAQPITAAPLRLVQEAPELRRPDAKHAPAIWIWGTGPGPEAGAARGRNTLYAVWDDGSPDPALERKHLQAARVDSTLAVQAPAFSWGTAPQPSDSSVRAGWLLDLPASGEAMRHAVQRVGDTLLVDSLDAQGQSRLYSISLRSGQGRVDASLPGALAGLWIAQGGGPYQADGARSGWAEPTRNAQGQSLSDIPVLSYGTAGIQRWSGRLVRRSGRLSWRPIHALPAMPLTSLSAAPTSAPPATAPGTPTP